MASSPKRLGCDLALWEATPGLLDGVSDRLRSVQRIDGASLRTLSGYWHRRNVLIASATPNGTLRPAIETLLTTHQPERVLLLGAASGIAPEAKLGEWIRATRVMDQSGVLRPPFATEPEAMGLEGMLPGVLAEGTVTALMENQATPLATTHWAARYDDALQLIGIGMPMLGVVVCRREEAGGWEPPPLPQSLARQAGRAMGLLFRRPSQMGGLLDQQATTWRCQRAIADRLEQVVRQVV